MGAERDAARATDRRTGAGTGVGGLTGRAKGPASPDGDPQLTDDKPRGPVRALPAAAALPPEVDRRFEAAALGVSLWRDRREARLLRALAQAGMATAIIDPGGERHHAARTGRRRSVESRSTESFASVAEAVANWWAQGVRASESVILASEEGAPPVDPGSDHPGEELGAPGAGRPALLQVGPAEARAILRDQLARRTRRDLPTPPVVSAWTVAADGARPETEVLRDVRLAMVDGVAGTLASPLADYPPAERTVYVAGVYTGEGSESRLLQLPDWAHLEGRLDTAAPISRILDMRTGLLHHDMATERGPLRAVSFASRARPGIGALRAGGASAVVRDADGRSAGQRATQSPPVIRATGSPGGAAMAVDQSAHGRGGSARLDRIAAIVTDGRRVPRAATARSVLAGAAALGFDRLLAEQRAAWAARWADADILVEGDDEIQRAVRYALYELMAHGVEKGESAIGARGITGPKYRGHVFWDTDIFVLPFLAATRPRAARAILEYRARRLGSAIEAAREAGLAGARMPWESAADGRDVTPDQIPRRGEAPLTVLTGPYELHITADVAWAAATYLDWTGDQAFARRPGGELLFETARYWASRIEVTAGGSAHISRVVGPDEYHAFVDDNAYTNVMARWNLRRAATWPAPDASWRAGRSAAPDAAERAAWLDLADRLVDGFDRGSGIYEQFDGYFGLEPVRIAELATRPLSGEVFLGRDRVAATQCVKQPDVLMLYHVIPDELAPGTLEPNLDFYDPRTSHGSSLSPGIHASLLARAGQTEEALAALRMIAFIDLDDASRGTAEGLHMAALGCMWQAMAFGFAGLRLAGDGLAVDPHLPSGWRSLEVPVRLRGRRVRVRAERDRICIWADRPVTVRIAGLKAAIADRRGLTALRRGNGWTLAD